MQKLPIGKAPTEPPDTAREVEAIRCLRIAVVAVAEAESALRQPVACALVRAAAGLEDDAIPGLQALESVLRQDQPPLDGATRLSLAEEGAALQVRIAGLGQLLEGAARFHAGWAAELAARRGYSAEGVTLPLSVVRSVGRRCNVQA